MLEIPGYRRIGDRIPQKGTDSKSPMIIAVNRTNWADADTFVVCLDCGCQFIYDLKTMRVGPESPRSRPAVSSIPICR
jgi:hypothetical protein